MQTQMPDGKLLTEFFDDEESMKKRRAQLEQAGGVVQRVMHVHSSKYEPHQGKREKMRRIEKALHAA